jgi:hypothetical protein
LCKKPARLSSFRAVGTFFLSFFLRYSFSISVSLLFSYSCHWIHSQVALCCEFGVQHVHHGELSADVFVAERLAAAHEGLVRLPEHANDFIVVFLLF